MNTLNLHDVQTVELGPVNSILVGDKVVHYRTLRVETGTGPITLFMYAEKNNVQINVKETS